MRIKVVAEEVDFIVTILDEFLVSISTVKVTDGYTYLTTSLL